MKEPKLTLLGASHDHRTNRWEFTCDCGYSEKLRTTMFPTDQVQCKNCQKDFFIDYNNLIITELK